MKYIFYFILAICLSFILFDILDFFSQPDSIEIVKESTNLAIDIWTSNKILLFLFITVMFVPAFLSAIFKKRH